MNRFDIIMIDMFARFSLWHYGKLWYTVFLQWKYPGAWWSLRTCCFCDEASSKES